MKLKFIGKDGSMGLVHGKIYRVSLRTIGDYIIAYISKGLYHEVMCPYESLKAFAANWELE